MPFVPTHRARFLAQGLDLIGVVFGRHNGGVSWFDANQILFQIQNKYIYRLQGILR
jgi:hypothetical protein